MDHIKVAEYFHHPPFFSKDAVDLTSGTPFLESMLFLMGEMPSPLLTADQMMRTFFSDFKKESDTIGQHFRSRNGKLAQPIILLHLSRIIQMLFWNEGMLCPPLNELEKKLRTLNNTPLNAAERIVFILRSPSQFQSFIQLKELFLEFEKKVAADTFRDRKKNEDKT